MAETPLIATKEVSRTYRLGDRSTKALVSVDLSVARGETLAVVGESGSGKSTLGRMLLGTEAPDEGTVLFDGSPLKPPLRRPLRRRLQVIQQNPNTTFNPRRTIGQSVTLPLAVHGLMPKAGRRDRAAKLLEAVGLPPDILDRYPSALSGGQLQRAALARALACEPELLVLDEPTSALDVSVQARVLALLTELQARLGITYVFITHDLAVVRNVANSVAVLYRGHLVERAPVLDLFRRPRHHYTVMLLSSIPVVSAEEEAIKPKWPVSAFTAISDTVSEGCAFASRCPFAIDICRLERPRLSQGSHAYACHNPAPTRYAGAEEPALEDVR